MLLSKWQVFEETTIMLMFQVAIVLFNFHSFKSTKRTPIRQLLPLPNHFVDVLLLVRSAPSIARFNLMLQKFKPRGGFLARRTLDYLLLRQFTRCSPISLQAILYNIGEFFQSQLTINFKVCTSSNLMLKLVTLPKFELFRNFCYRLKPFGLIIKDLSRYF